MEPRNSRESSFTFAIKTMGCKANVYDSLLIERELRELGGLRAAPGAPADLFVVNSCTVTAEADRQTVREVKWFKKKSPDTIAVVTGCSAEVSAKSIAANPEVNLVLPNSRKSAFKSTIAETLGLKAQASAVDPEIFWGQLPVEVGKTRAFLKIQEGCNDFCTYCIIPYARGKSRSVKLGEILSEIARLCALGIHEVILTGTNIADYGKELGLCFEDLVESILEKTSLPRLRLSSLDPTEITDRLLGLMTPGARLMPHVHVSLQSPVSRVLRAMKREYRRDEVEDALHRVARACPDAFVGMDVIAGFPSESIEEHEEAIQTLEALPWTRLHVFPYSEREGTPATRIPGAVPLAERKRRAASLMTLSHSKHKEFTKRFVGKRIERVLFESWHEAGGEFFAVGHAENYQRVMARAASEEMARNMHNRLGAVRIEGASPKPAQDWTLEGVLE